MKMSPKNIAMLVVIGVLFVVVIVLLIVGISTHEEEGLLTACETPSGRFDYTEDCADVTWQQDQIPLLVHASTTNPNPPNDPERATSSVIDLVNSRLGFDALAWTDDTDEADITIEVGAAQELDSAFGMLDAHGYASHYRRPDGSLACEIRTWNTGTLEMLDKALTHEVYHALGLAHDPDYPGSAMYPTVEPDGDRITRLRATDHDRRLLRELYAR